VNRSRKSLSGVLNAPERLFLFVLFLLFFFFFFFSEEWKERWKGDGYQYVFPNAHGQFPPCG
jgi:hypothetical protein